MAVNLTKRPASKITEWEVQMIEEVAERLNRISTAPYSGDGRPPKTTKPLISGSMSVRQLARAIARDKALMEKYIYDAAWVPEQEFVSIVMEDQVNRIKQRARGLGLTVIDGVSQEALAIGGYTGGYTVRSEAKVGDVVGNSLVIWTPDRRCERKLDEGHVYEADVITNPVRPISLVKVEFQQPCIEGIVL